MNHTSIATGLSQFIKPMAYLKETNPNVTFVLGETNSDYINLGIPEFTGVFGNALWVCDYLLYGMSLVSPIPPSRIPTNPYTLPHRTSLGYISIKAQHSATQHGCPSP